MKTSVATHIVVGVDDSAGSRSALGWSAWMADLQRCPITLVHAYPDLSNPPSRGFWIPEHELQAESQQILDRAEEQLRLLGWRGDEPDLVARPGSPVDVITNVAEGHRMLVVGRRGGAGFVRSLLGSTAYGAAEHAKVPTVVVPDTWEPRARPQGDVVLGLDGADTGDAAVAFAFEAASRMGSRLHCVHVCQPFDPYLPVQVFVGENRQWMDSERRCLFEQVAGWREKYPDLDVQHDVLSGHEVGTLLGLAASARLLVVGGRARSRLRGALLGSVGRGVVHHADCPVAVVHRPGRH